MGTPSKRASLHSHITNTEPLPPIEPDEAPLPLSSTSRRGLYSEFLGTGMLSGASIQGVTKGPRSVSTLGGAAILRRAALSPQVEHGPAVGGGRSHLARRVPRPRPAPLPAAPDQKEYEEEVVEEPVEAIAEPESEPLAAWHSDAPARSLEPKVMVPFTVPPGHTPRRVEIERKKREFNATDLEQLMSEIEISSDILPLECFDNTEFDCRTVDEWKSLAYADGELKYLPGRCLSEGKWLNVHVVGFHPDNSFHVRYVDSNGQRVKEEDHVSRLRLYFLAEDPVVFANRIAAAHRKRSETESLLKYHLYVDCMPSEGILDEKGERLRKEQQRRTLDSATATLQRTLKTTTAAATDEQQPVMQRRGGLKQFGPWQPLLHSLIQESQLSYLRAMNKLTLDAALGDPAHKALFASLVLPPPEPVEPVRASGVEVIPPHDFNAQVREFTFASFLTKVEVIKALILVRDECLVQENERLVFNVSISKSVRLDEFDQMQGQSLQSALVELKEAWVPTLKQHIKSSLRDVGKGWFNLKERNKEVYDVSKLKKFMGVVRFMMEDALRTLTLRSVSLYAGFISEACAYDVSVKGTGMNSVSVTDARRQRGARMSRHPLFLVDLIIEGDETNARFGLSTAPELFQKRPIALFKEILGSLGTIPQIEKQVMEDLFWAHDPMLDSVHELEEYIQTTLGCIESDIARALVPLREYLRCFGCYDDLIRLNIESYISEYEATNPTTDEMKAEIIKHLDRKNEIEANIPKSISLGLFQVNCTTVLSKLAQKCKDLSVKILELLARKTRGKVDSIIKRFLGISKRLGERPPNIEALVSLREFKGTIPRLLRDVKENITAMFSDYDVIESLHFNLSHEDFNQRWVAFGWPQRIEEQMDDADALLERDKVRFQKDLVTEQEDFNENLDEITRVCAGFHKHTDIGKVNEVANEVRKIKKQLAHFEEQTQLFNRREGLFGLQVTEYTRLRAVVQQFEPYANMWLTAYNWLQWHESWFNSPFTSLDPDEMDRDLNDAWRIMFKLVKSFKEETKSLKIVSDIKDQIDEFKPHLPLIQALRNPGMRDRHWHQLSTDLGFHVRPDETFTLTTMFDLSLQDHLEQITKVTEVASKEYAIERELDKMESLWKDVNFTIIDYRNTQTFIMKGADDIIQLLDDHIVMTQGMAFNVYKKPHEERINKWEIKLKLVSEILEEWLTCQRNWLYLEPIFSSQDIVKQMPTESKRFQTMDRIWRKWMSQAKTQPQVLAMCSSEKLLEAFKECNKLLDLVQSGLSDYLETKRMAFPRFYFLSNDELLQILSETKDPHAVQPHLHKCFENITKIVFNDENLITQMVSADGEVVDIDVPFAPTGAVEDWLLNLESSMRSTLKGIMQESLKEYRSVGRSEWLKKEWPGQVILAVTQIEWTRLVEEAVSKVERGNTSALSEEADRQVEQLMALTDVVRGQLTALERLKLGPLIVMDVHSRDVTRKLVDSQVRTLGDYEWISQLRHYWCDPDDRTNKDDNKNDVSLRMVTSKFNYGYEFLGNSGRLVITPLTDRCYLTLTGALQMELGGAPQGPAGTGKTESVKDLAKTLAKKCVVFNCSEGLDYLAMGKFFKGLASSGAWSCFDEFNRIDLEVLSVIAQQILEIQKAIQLRTKRFIFEGTEIGLNPTCAVFITMNPGYAGRSELPDNLKALFRPVAMMVPDYAMIAEIMLYSFGFRDAFSLARKIVATFKLSSEQLSTQDHYDFGMRAVKTVISAAGNLKQAQGEMEENLILLRALRDVNVPKFLANDLALFNGIIRDLFPETEWAQPDYGSLMESISASCASLGLQPVDDFTIKCIQLYETTVVRHGLMLVGPTGGGKTSCYRVLAEAMSRLASHNIKPWNTVRTYVLNPKAVRIEELYGAFDPTTHEWTDGILAGIVREAASDTTEDRKWVVFDGPVDAIWIENMNTVLDDNKKLCLQSSEIIHLSPSMTMMFEVEDLAVASPATVSRCGMVYLDPESLGFQPVIKSWLNRLPRSVFRHHKKLQGLFDDFFAPAIEFMRKNLSEPVRTVNNNILGSLTRLLDCFIGPWREAEMEVAGDNGADPVPETKIIDLSIILEPLFLFSLVWSVGASTDSEGRPKFDAWLRSHMEAISCDTKFPSEGSVYDWVYDQNAKRFEHWMETQPAFNIVGRPSFSDIIVPTIDSVRNTFLLEMLITNGHHVMCVGPTGTGKSVTIQEMLMHRLDGKYQPLLLTFSARSTASQTQDFFDPPNGKLEKRSRRMMGPPLGKQYVVFVDDVNMPAREVYGAQPPIELLRQWLDFRGWYNRKSLQFMDITGMQLVTALGPPGGGRQPLTNRFKRHFNILSFPELEKTQLQRIFRTIVTWYLSTFEPAIKNLGGRLVDSTIDVYLALSKEKLPTPSRPHYTFNLRDLGKVFQGLLSADKSRINERLDMLRLWVHEATRVFHDRLVDEVDRKWFLGQLDTNLQKSFSITHDEVMPRPAFYGDFMIPGADPRLYHEIDNHDKLQHVIEEYLEDYNAVTNSGKMHLVMFKDAVDHVCRISRILRQPQGNALLLGVGGSGRQSLTRLAAHMADFGVFQIEVTKTYALAEWRDDLKRLLLTAGLQDRSIVFLFTDSQIVQETFLEDINNLLNSGEVPGIWLNDDMENIINTCRGPTQQAGLPLSKASIYAFFVSRVRKNLHMALCFSPGGEAFRRRLRMFPALVNCCSIDWFSRWPNDALRSVAFDSLKESKVFQEDAVQRESVADLCTFIHHSVEEQSSVFFSQLGRHNSVTPTSFLELLTLYKQVLEQRRKQQQELRDRLTVGLEKLLETTHQVENLQETLEVIKPELQQRSRETMETMEKIKRDKEEAQKTRAVVSQEEAEATRKAEETKAIADDARKELDKAMPALEAALQSLRTLDRRDIVEVRSMQRPPVGVKLVMETVCIMKQIKPRYINDGAGRKVKDFWGPSQTLMNQLHFLQDLENYPRDDIPDQVIKDIQPYLENEDFQPANVARVSKACTSLCLWVRAMEGYYHVSKMVKPKKLRLEEAERSLQATRQALEASKAKLKAVESSIEELETQFDESMRLKKELQNRADETQLKLDRAEKLLGGLSGERARWGDDVKEIDHTLQNLVGDCLIACATIAYLGGFTSGFRHQLMASWHGQLRELGIRHTANVTLDDVLGDPVLARQWTIAGLPRDSMSQENGIIVNNCRRWPLMIDPQGQANKWVRNMEKEQLEIVRPSEKDFVRTLENAIRWGRAVLLQNVGEELDTVLEPVLQRHVFYQQGQLSIKLGDSTIPYDDRFRLYITTKLPNPKYRPETSTKVTLLNFTLSEEGLEDQLLALVVAKERPDLEEAKNQLVVSNAKMRKELKEIEDTILYLLASSQGDPLSDEQLIDALGASKKTSVDIKRKVQDAERTEKEIDATRTLYRPVATRATVLFFLITDLARVDPMYQYSMEWFVVLYLAGIQNAPQSDKLDERLRHLNEYFTYSLYQNVCRSLFEKHKLLLSFLLAIRILVKEGTIDSAELRFLIAGGVPRDDRVQPNPVSGEGWLTERSWAEIQALSELPSYEGFSDAFVEHLGFFKRYFDSLDSHREDLPGEWNAKLQPFQKMLVLRCIRPDKMSSAIQDFVTANLGQRFIEPPAPDLELSYRDSNPAGALIFILSPGADPASQLDEFAERKRFAKKLAKVSLGQGQGPRAEKLVREARERGTWVLLQNCHLAVSWMPELERLMEEINPEKVHRDFRLWLTSMPSPEFPVSVLQNGVKMTNEPPKGIKQGLLRTYVGLDDAYLNSCRKPAIFKKMLFSLSFFHAVIVERKRFGPLGWNIPYEYTAEDLAICRRQLAMFLDQYEEVPFYMLKQLAGEIHYGGRVTDERDRRTLEHILEQFYTPRLLDDESFSFSSSGTYVLPHGDTQKSFLRYIRTLPHNDRPEIFGLHDNADITFANNETFQLFDTVLAMQPKGASATVGARDQMVEQLILRDLEAKLPDLIDEAKVLKLFPNKYEESMNTVLIQEVLRFNKLLKVVRRTLHEVVQAIRGFVVMSGELDLMADSLFDNQVPGLWEKVAYPSLKPLASWMVDLQDRVQFINCWITSGTPKVFWMSGFFFPQAFLTGTLQNYARKYRKSIDTISFDFEVLDQTEDRIPTRPADGCYVRGLFLEGARWDAETKKLAESRPKELFTDLPIMWLKPVKDRVGPSDGIYTCPIYKTLRRAGTLSTTGHSTNFVLAVELPSDVPQEHWIRRGVALLCALNY